MLVEIPHLSTKNKPATKIFHSSPAVQLSRRRVQVASEDGTVVLHDKVNLAECCDGQVPGFPRRKVAKELLLVVPLLVACCFSENQKIELKKTALMFFTVFHSSFFVFTFSTIFFAISMFLYTSNFFV